ncbi:NADAR family protein [Paenibacillus harenae]|uniref:RibA/ribD-fused uncharacterized protein n=1 Tax=Paenibacillus harenae TaxID=306543 RepID=A0ABT9TYH6_PAEHA|nr:NADAR family protein [Paenibacillus harenae]MDQ0112430.1 ribA/ribD-fused uncharacterized protein [Paenibacillus harenae]
MHNILFYQTDRPYGCFSNFSKFPIEVDNKLWPTTEHYFQGMKFKESEHEELIRLAPTPMAAAKMGRERTRPLRADWEQVKDEVMRTAIHAKVNQHNAIKSILLSTGNCNLIEHTSNDSYWADGGDGTGKNMLGLILMEIRNSLEGYKDEFHLPQWMTFPEVEPFSIFWRMGRGEDFMITFHKWLDGMSEEARKEYWKYFNQFRPIEWIEAKRIQDGRLK